MVIPRVTRYAGWDDQHVSVNLHGAHYSRADWSGAQLGWRIGGTDLGGKRAIEELERGVAKDLALLDLTLPQVDQAQPVQVFLEIIYRCALAALQQMAHDPATDAPVAAGQQDVHDLTSST